MERSNEMQWDILQPSLCLSCRNIAAKQCIITRGSFGIWVAFPVFWGYFGMFCMGRGLPPSFGQYRDENRPTSQPHVHSCCSMKSSSEKASHLHCFILVLNSRYRKETPCIQSNIPFYIWPLTGWKVGLCWWKHFVRLMMDPKKKSWVFLPPSSKLRGRIVDLPVFHLFQPLKASCEGKYTDITQFCTNTRHKRIIFFASAM